MLLLQFNFFISLSVVLCISSQYFYCTSVWVQLYVSDRVCVCVWMQEYRYAASTSAVWLKESFTPSSGSLTGNTCTSAALTWTGELWRRWRSSVWSSITAALWLMTCRRSSSLTGSRLAPTPPSRIRGPPTTTPGSTRSIRCCSTWAESRAKLTSRWDPHKLIRSLKLVQIKSSYKYEAKTGTKMFLGQTI